MAESYSAKKANGSVLVEYILTYYKATFRTNHVPRSVVLHQYGIRVIRTLNSGKCQSISTAEAEKRSGDQTAQKA